jgi:hypothetical protein
MTTLLVEKLVNELEANITYSGLQRVHIGAFIPYLYLHNAQADYFTLTLTGVNGEVFSKNFTVSDVKTSLGTVNNYAHVFYPVIPSNPVQIGAGNYTLKLVAGPNYVNSQSSFIGWIKQFENLQNELSYVPSSDASNPLAYRLKILKEGIL